MPMNRWCGLALCWDKAYFPYRTDHYEGWTNFPGWGVNQLQDLVLHPARSLIDAV